MIPILTEHDKNMIEKTDKWLYLGDDGVYHLKENAPNEIKSNYNKIQQMFKEF